MDTLNEDAKLAVKRGIYWLDENHPGWEKKIDLDTFDISECSSCVVGQAIGDYNESIRDASGVNYPEYLGWAVEHGFESPVAMQYSMGISTNVSYGYSEIETLWTEEVKSRLG